MLLVYTWTWLADDNKWKNKKCFRIVRQTNERIERKNRDFTMYECELECVEVFRMNLRSQINNRNMFQLKAHSAGAKKHVQCALNVNF